MLKDGFVVKVNPDKEFVKNLKERIAANDGYCPCQLERNEDTKCTCKIFRETNECECGLFVVEKR